MKSTGPVTFEGKRHSRCNAVRHGLTAETVITAFENTEDYEAFQATVISDYDAETAVERELVLRLASALWRLRRSTLIETGLFEAAVEALSHQQQFRNLDESAARLSYSSLAAALESPEKNASDIKRDIAHCFLHLADLPGSAHVRLSRYEQALWRQVRQLVFTLESLRRRRRRVSQSTFPFSLRRRESADLSEES